MTGGTGPLSRRRRRGRCRRCRRPGRDPRAQPGVDLGTTGVAFDDLNCVHACFFDRSAGNGDVVRVKLHEATGEIVATTVTAGDSEQIASLPRAHTDHPDRTRAQLLQRACDQILNDEKTQVKVRAWPVILAMPLHIVTHRHTAIMPTNRPRLPTHSQRGPDRRVEDTPFSHAECGPGRSRTSLTAGV